MDRYLLWLICGFVLAIAELLTGTFYLLVLGVAAFAGALVAWLGYGDAAQAILAAMVAVAGSLLVRFWVRGRKRASLEPAMPALDVGQPVVFDTWTDQAGGRARVRYRDTLWDAVVQGDAAAPGDTLYIVAVDGSTLRVARRA